MSTILAKTMSSMCTVFLGTRSVVSDRIGKRLRVHRTIAHLIGVAGKGATIRVHPRLLARRTRGGLCTTLRGTKRRIADTCGTCSCNDTLPTLGALAMPVGRFLSSIVIVIRRRTIEGGHVSLLVGILRICKH